MAGRNIVLLPGRKLFSAGEASDGMYLIRRGKLLVFIEVQGRETTLAEVTTGAMIGEMALNQLEFVNSHCVSCSFAQRDCRNFSDTPVLVIVLKKQRGLLTEE